jgi:protein-disulfide isomerase
LLPLLAVVLLVSLALGVAGYLVFRNRQESAGNNPTPTTAVASKVTVTTQGWSRGNPSAKTVLVEFADFQCGACGVHRTRVDKLLKKYPNDLFVVFKNFPLESVHKNALLAAQAAEAAGKQFKFWEMYDQLFLHQIEWYNVPDPMTFILKYAQACQLDLNRFQQDLWSLSVQEKIFRDKFEGQQANVVSVPTFFLNGKMLATAQNDDHFESMVAEEIKKAK